MNYQQVFERIECGEIKSLQGGNAPAGWGIPLYQKEKIVTEMPYTYHIDGQYVGHIPRNPYTGIPYTWIPK